MLRRPRRVLALSILLFISVAYSTSLAGRCAPRTLQENFDSHEVVFSGTVEEKNEAPEEYGQTFESVERSWVTPAIEVRFKVDKIWKGNTNDHVTLYTTDPSPSTSRPYVHPSGYPFESNSKYLVFASYTKSRIKEDNDDAEPSNNDELHLRTSWCAGNMVLGDKFIARPFLVDLESEDDLLSQLSEFKSKSDVADKNDGEEAVDEKERANPS